MNAKYVANGLVASLARPGGNVTGVSNQQAAITGKRVQLLREVSAGLRRLAILGNVGNPAVVLEMSGAQAAAAPRPDRDFAAAAEFGRATNK